MSTLRINNIEAKSVPASPTLDEKIKLTNSSGDVLVHVDGKTSGITTIGINTTAGNITFDANSNVVVTGIITATKFVGTIEPTNLTVSGDLTIPDKIIHSGDTNTAIRFPAADTITAETGGSERLRIDSSGRVMIGTTTEGAVSANNVTIAASGYCGMTIRSGTSSEGNIFFSDATSGNGESVGMLRYEHNNDAMVIKTNNAERVRISSNGDVRIGGGVPATFGSGTTVHETYNVNTYVANLVTSGTHQLQMIASQTHGATSIGTRSNHNLNLCANDSTKMTITSGGQIGINQTNPARALTVNALGTGTSSRLVRLATQDNSTRFDFSFENTDFLTIQNGINDSAILKLHKSGYVTKPATPTFSAIGSGDAISAQSPLPYDSMEYNNGNHYNNSTHKFTCPVTGYYYVTCHVVPTNFSTPNNVELYIKDQSGNRYFLDRKVKSNNYSTNNFSVGGSRILYKSAGNTLWVEFNSINGSPTLESSSHFGITLMA